MILKDEDGIANSEDTGPLGAVLSGSAMFVQTFPSKNLGSLVCVTSVFIGLFAASLANKACFLMMRLRFKEIAIELG